MGYRPAMSKSDRLFRLPHLLRTLPAPVTAARLADEVGVNPRKLYGDNGTLRAGGALIDGAPGNRSGPPRRSTRPVAEASMLLRLPLTWNPDLGRGIEGNRLVHVDGKIEVLPRLHAGVGAHPGNHVLAR